MPTEREIDLAGLEARITALPGFDRLRQATLETGIEARVIGGAVRDALLGRASPLDVVTEGDHLALAAALGGELRVHERFGTATARTPDGPIDVVRARAESYAHPGALPEVVPASYDEDVARRDFTVNTIAVDVAEPGRPIDPRDGLGDLREGLLRSLHGNSFVDDPTRALRAARYAARLDLAVEGNTLEDLRAARLEDVSAERFEAELRRTAGERDPMAAFELLARWGLVTPAPGAAELIGTLGALLERERWSSLATRETAILAALRGDLGAARDLAAAHPERGSEIVARARGHTGLELVLARALGAGWLDRYLDELRDVRLEISGNDLLAAGVVAGPAVGAGLAAALRAKLDGEAAGRDEELRVALAAAEGGP